MEPLNEQQWRQRFEEAEQSFKALRQLAETPIDQEIDTNAAMLAWARQLQALDLANLGGDPAFTAPLLRELLEMNDQLIRLFSARRDAIASAHAQQKKAHKGVNAYRRAE